MSAPAFPEGAAPKAPEPHSVTGVRIDHFALPARDADWSARYLATLLGDVEARPAGPDGDMCELLLDHGASLLFMTAPEVPRGHVALRVDAARFEHAVAELRERSVPFGNDPSDPENGRTDDRLGSTGRVYFADPDGHLIELVTG
jgi:catechol 2,3-dioxygenase-like lactoylglutathione lyase family enzyme